MRRLVQQTCTRRDVMLKQSHKTLLWWTLLIVAFVAVWQLLAPTGPKLPARGDSSGSLGLSGWVAIVVGVLVGLRIWATHDRGLERAWQSALRDTNAGRFDDADRALLPFVHHRLAHLRRSAQYRSAEIAFLRADVGEALRRADAAARLPITGLARGSQRSFIQVARSLRAILRASQGDEAGVAEDLAYLRAAANLAGPFRIRCALAELVLLDHKGDRAGLRVAVDAYRPLLSPEGYGFERALVRAYEAMLLAGERSAYRSAVEAPNASSDNRLVRWVRSIAPNAVPFLRARDVAAAETAAKERSASPALAPPLPPPSDEARRGLLRSRPPRTRRAARVTAVWTLFFVLAVGGWSLVSASAPRLSALWGTMLMVILLFVVIAGFIRMGARQRKRLKVAVSAFDDGRWEEAPSGSCVRTE
jgi:hypothetical protein